MTFWAVVGVIEICVLLVELDDDWADAVFHVDSQAVARVTAKRSKNAFRMACFIAVYEVGYQSVIQFSREYSIAEVSVA